MNAKLKTYKKYTFLFLYYAFLSYFTYLMVLITSQYVPINFEVAFLRIKDAEIVTKHYQIAFFSHVYTSIFALMIGITQFSKYLRIRIPKLHKRLGKIYILIVLLVSAPSGLVMAYYANGGLFSQISFSIQAVLWFLFTLLAFRHAKSRKWKLHENFMLRSYALTLSAISLRLIKWGIVTVFELPPMDTYKIVAWAGWLVNILIVEIYIFSKKNYSTL